MPDAAAGGASLGILCCWVAALLSSVTVLGLASPLQLWDRGDDQDTRVHSQVYFFSAFSFLFLCGCIPCFAILGFSCNDVELPGREQDDLEQAEAVMSRVESCAKEARRAQRARICFFCLSSCPLPLLLLFAGCIIGWVMICEGVQLNIVYGVSCGIFGTLALCCFCCCCCSSEPPASQHHDMTDVELLQIVASAIDGPVEQALCEGTLRLISVEWLLQADNFTVMERRQELPEEAFAKKEEATRMHREGRVDVLSYGWLQPGCPDPHGLYLKALRRYYKSVGPESAKRGLFWDFACLPQLPRTEEEETLFRQLLSLMGNLYGSMWRTTVLQHKLVPHANASGVDGSEGTDYNTRPYECRGWCRFEEGSAVLAAGHRQTSDTATFLERHPKLIDISGAYPHVVELSEPPPLASLEKSIEEATFTVEGDRQRVIVMLKFYGALLMVAATKRRALIEMETAKQYSENRLASRISSRVLGRSDAQERECE